MARKALRDEIETRLIAAIDAAEQGSYGGDQDSELASERALSIDYYLGRNTIPAPDGRSQVVDRSVFETIQWIKPSLLRVFANGDDVVNLPPVGPEDEQTSRQEAQYLNHVMLRQNNWFAICDTWFTDALLTKNAYLYVYRETEKRVEYEKYEDQTAQSIALLMGDGDAEIIEQEVRQAEDGSMEPVVDETGQPVMDDMGQPAMQPAMLYSVTIRRTLSKNRYCMKVLPPENCKIASNTDSYSAQDADYFEYFCDKTVSDLRASGIDVDEDMANQTEAEPDEAQARDQFNEEQGREAYADDSMKRIRVRYVWLRHDMDEDGVAEYVYAVRIGQRIAYVEPINRVPIASIVAIPLPHRHMGLSIADITADIQDIKTAILRGGLDNIYLANQPRHAISGKVNLDDMLVSRPGGVVRVGDVDESVAPAEHIMPLVTPFIFPQAMEGMEYMDAVRENRTGTNRYFTGIDQNAMNKTATGIQQLTTMAAQRVEMIARIFAPGVREAASILHELILKSGHKQEVVQLRGQWVDVDPAQWRKRTDFDVTVGYAAGNKDAQVQKLMLLAQKQGEALASGIPIVQPVNLYETAVEITKAMDMSNPNRFWTDPTQIPPQEKPPDPMVQMQMLKNQTDEKTTAAELQQKERDSQRDAEIQKYKADLDAQVKLTLANQQASHAKEMESLKGEQTAGLEVVKANLNPKIVENKRLSDESKQKDNFVQQFMQSQQQQTQAIMQVLAEIMNGIRLMSGPKRVVRGRDGRAEMVIPVEGTETRQ